MSVSEVQQRIASLQARFPGLDRTAPSQASFAATLQSTAALQSPTSASGLGDLATDLPGAATGAGTGAAAVAVAEKQIGTPYVFGGEQPGGFDCSGLMQWSYAQLGVSLPRTAAEQGRTGVPVSPADAQPGDLVYFDKAGPVDHIGMYIGNGQWVVAPHTGAKVRIESVDLSKATSIRRVTGTASVPPSSTASPDWAGGLPPKGRLLASDIQQAADATGVDPRLIASVAWTESDFDNASTSSAGAQGVMQLMPQTAAGLGVDPLTPSQALLGGARYLKQQLDAFGGRVDLALAAYNAGPTAVRKAGGIPPYRETQDYVSRVLTHLQQLGGSS